MHPSGHRSPSRSPAAFFFWRPVAAIKERRRLKVPHLPILDAGALELRSGVPACHQINTERAFLGGSRRGGFSPRIETRTHADKKKKGGVRMPTFAKRLPLGGTQQYHQ